MTHIIYDVKIKLSEADMLNIVYGGEKVLENIQIMGKVTIKELRQLTGLSQADFAKKVNIPFTTYRRYEKNPSSMEVGRLFKMCEILNVSVANIRL